MKTRPCINRRSGAPCCWHFTGKSTTDGLAEEGYDEQVCCFCGSSRDRKWYVVRESPKGHGRFVAQRVKKFRGDETPGGTA